MGDQPANILDAKTPRPLSVIEARDPTVLQLMLGFYAKPGARILDVTANRRKMWQGVSWNGPITYSDIDPDVSPDIIADFRDLPFDRESYDVVVFDPPHLPAAAATSTSSREMVFSYGLAHAPRGDNISSLFAPALAEIERVLTPDGLALCKLKDFVHNHAYQWSLVDFIAAVRDQPGLTACDLIVKRDPCGGNLKSGRWKKAYHARNAHCWWIVVRKGRCEPRPGRAT
jgi:SAM-dependent methyltransferase